MINFRKNVTLWRSEEIKFENTLKKVKQDEKIRLGKRKPDNDNEEVSVSKKVGKKGTQNSYECDEGADLNRVGEVNKTKCQ